jgi:hypothetical protein
MGDFKDIFDDMPSWQELGRRVEAVRKDGSTVIGKVTDIDMTPGPDEQPILGIIVGDETFAWDSYEFEKWRYAA